jgi:flavin reductase (DIM6/NTAB) family NADH-FMN oxidoreductase RutF
MEDFLRVPKHLLSRLLYAPPACILISINEQSPAHGLLNAMTISWMSCLDNHGNILLSINHTRHTLQNLRIGALFTLSPLAEGMESDALKIGSCSGANIDKIQKLGIPTVAFGPAPLCCHKSSPARLLCRVLAPLAPPLAPDVQRPGVDSVTLLCAIQQADVARDYWLSQKLFAPSSESLPRLLAFLGSKTFCAITPLVTAEAMAEARAESTE